jgi:uncharacterized hydantoinase/oxoprolinase family protein
MAKVTLAASNTGAVTVGNEALIKIDASASAAKAAAGAPETCVVVDVGSGGLGLVPLHHVAQAASGEFSLQVAFNGKIPVIAA